MDTSLYPVDTSLSHVDTPLSLVDTSLSPVSTSLSPLAASRSLPQSLRASLPLAVASFSLSLSQSLSGPSGEARGCSSNTVVIHLFIEKSWKH